MTCPFFAYKGRNARGEMVKGRLESPDSGSVATQLFNSGIIPIDIAQTGAGAHGGVEDWLSRFLPRRSPRLTSFSSAVRCTPCSRRECPSSGPWPACRNPPASAHWPSCFQDLRFSLDSGRELNAAMRRHPQIFSPFYVAMVRVGEMTGRLEETFLRLYDHLEFERDMRERIQAALRYPAFVVVAMAVAIVIINLFVIPAFAKVYAGFKAELPLMTQILIGFSNFMVNQWPLLLAMLASAVIGFKMYTATPAGRAPVGQVETQTSRCRENHSESDAGPLRQKLFACLQERRSGLQSLSVVALVVDNDYVAQRIEQMRDGWSAAKACCAPP